MPGDSLVMSFIMYLLHFFDHLSFTISYTALLFLSSEPAAPYRSRSVVNLHHQDTETDEATMVLPPADYSNIPQRSTNHNTSSAGTITTNSNHHHSPTPSVASSSDHSTVSWRFGLCALLCLTCWCFKKRNTESGRLKAWLKKATDLILDQVCEEFDQLFSASILSSCCDMTGTMRLHLTLYLLHKGCCTLNCFYCQWQCVCM